MASKKDKCFKEAMDEYNKYADTKDQLDIKHQETWIKNWNGEWIEGSRFITSSFWDFVRMITSGKYAQFRTPDFTIQTGEGKLVVDNKFTNSKGEIDPWRTQQGKSGSLQLDDYNEINDQLSNGNSKTDKLALDKDNCKCQDNPPRQHEVKVEVLSPVGQLFFVPLPMGVPALSPLTFPVFQPVPSFVPVIP